MSKSKRNKWVLLSVLGTWAGIAATSAAFAAVPDAPTGVFATAGNGSVTVAFVPPTNNGGSAIIGFTANCGALSQTGASSPIIVGGIAGGASVSCTVAATNSEGTGSASPVSNTVTPLFLTAVTSRKTHSTAGAFDLAIDRSQPMGGLVTVEPRSIGSGHTLAYRFDGTVTSAGSATVSPVGTATTTSTSNEVLVTLTNVPDNQRVTVSLANVNGSVNLPPVSMGFLVGDVNNTRSVDNADIAAVKAKSGTAVALNTSVFDMNATGKITSADVAGVKVQSGKALSTSGPTITSAAPSQPAPNAAYCHTFVASQTIPSNGWAIVAGVLPVWLTLNTNRGVICGIPLLTDVGTANFTVAATNTSGTGTQAVTMTVAIPAPTITQLLPTFGVAGATVAITGSAFTGVTAVTIGGQPATFTFNSATSITAIVPSNAATGAGNVIVTTPGGQTPTGVTSAFTVTVPGANDVSVDGFTLPNPSKIAKVNPPVHGGLNGAGFYMNAYAMEPTRCNTAPALTRSWQHNIDFFSHYSQTQLDVFSLQGTEALSYKFTAPTALAAGGMTYDENLQSLGVVRAAFVSITSAPCDFNPNKVFEATGLANFDGCYVTQSAGVNINWRNFTNNPPPFPQCILTPGQTYYFNFRFQDARPAVQGGSPTATSCTPGLTCGGQIVFNGSGGP